MSHSNFQIALFALKSIGHILLFDSTSANRLIEFGLFDKLYPVLSSDDGYVKTQAFWCLGVIVKMNETYRKLAIERKTISFVLNAIHNCMDRDLMISYVSFSFIFCYFGREISFEEVCNIIFPNERISYIE